MSDGIVSGEATSVTIVIVIVMSMTAEDARCVGIGKGCNHWHVKAAYECQ